MDAIVIYVDMPCKIRGFVLKNKDDSHTIFINSRINCEQQKEVYEHEMSHIKNNDFECEDINTLEYIRHKI